MRKILKGAVSVLLSAVLTIPMFSMTAFAEERPTVEIPVAITQTGKSIVKTDTVNVVLTPAEVVCPMPEGTADGVYKLAFTGSATQDMAPIAFDKVGIYSYAIHQEKGIASKCTYDETVYDMTIYVTNAETGGLETTVVMHVDGVEAKPGKVEFSNQYRSSSGGGGGGGNPSPGGSTPSTGGPGATTEITDGETPTTTILPFDVPLALPQTGTLWWLVPILAIAGLVMFFGGMMKGRKKNEDEEI